MEEFDLKRFSKMAYSRRVYIICIMIILIVIGYLYSFIYKIPEYKSSAKIVLAQINSGATDMSENNSITQADITLNQNLVDTYSDIIKSKKVLKSVIENLGIDMEQEELYDMISVTSGTSSETLSIDVVSEDAELAKNIANEVVEVFSQNVAEIYQIENVYVLDEAEIAEIPYNVNHIKDMCIFVFIGLFISFSMVLLVYMFDTTVKQEEDVEENVGLSVYGVVPLKTESENKKDEDDLELSTTEAFRTLRTNITFGRNNSQLKNILITSSYSGEGKSYISSNLAIALARANKKVLILDADMRKGRQHQIFKIENTKGLSNCLEDNNVENISSISKYIKTTKIPNLHIMTSGDRLSNQSELLASTKVVDILKVLNEIYDIVVIDGTPSIIVADSVALSKYVKNVIVVAAYKSTKIENLKKLKKSFENVGSNVSGVVINKYPLEESAYRDDYYYNDSKADNRKKDKNQKVQSVNELIEEVKKNKLENAFEEVLEENKTEILPKEINEKSLYEASEDNNLVLYKMENMSQELNTIKNLFIQYAMNNQTMSKDDLNNIKSEIESLRNVIEKDNGKDKEIKELKKDLEAIRRSTQSLIDKQNSDAAKIRKFINEYKNK